MRAGYADDVAANFLHPFHDADDNAVARELHGRIVDLIGPVSRYLAQAEAAYLASLTAGVVTVTEPDGSKHPMQRPR
jgi:hypothetical protein